MVFIPCFYCTLSYTITYPHYSPVQGLYSPCNRRPDQFPVQASRACKGVPGRPMAYVYSCNIYAAYCIFIQINGLFLYFYTVCAYTADNYRYTYLVDGQLTPLSFHPRQKPEHSTALQPIMYGFFYAYSLYKRCIIGNSYGNCIRYRHRLLK